MSDKTSSKSGGIGFTGLLTIVFITLKLCGVINWSWWLVLAPIWISVVIAGIILAGFALAFWITRPRTPREKAIAAIRHYMEVRK